MKLKKSEFAIILFGVLTILSILNITYLNRSLHIDGTAMTVLRLLIIGGINVLMMIKRRKISLIYKLLIGWMVIMIVVSALQDGDIVYFVSVQSRAMVIISALEYYCVNERKLLLILDAWKYVLLLLCILDFASILLFPDGLYIGDDYSSNWFLGYKTARMVYSLPLSILVCYTSIIKGKSIRMRDLIVVTMCSMSCFLIGATGAAVALLLFTLMIYLCAIWKRSKNFRELLGRILSYKLIIILYSVISALVIAGDSLIIRFSLNVAGKGTTLSHRTEIWYRCWQYIMKYPIFGNGYLTTDQYVNNITMQRLGSNAHNMIISILVTTGIVGLALYLFIIKKCFDNAKENINLGNVVLKLSFISFLVIGITSSALIFSPFSFFALQLMYYNVHSESIHISHKRKFKLSLKKKFKIINSVAEE